MKRIHIGPLTRANNVCAVEVEVEDGRVVSARSSGMFFRGFEIILRGRDPRDAPYLTQRICGICSSAHGVAAARALESAAGVSPPRNATILRNLLMGADLLQSHIRHIYLLAMPDYVKGPRLGPFTPSYKSGYRLPEKINDALVKHYFEAVKASRTAHEMVALLGGKAPHSHGLIAGGTPAGPTADVLVNLRFKLSTVTEFISEVMEPDILRLAEAYQDHFSIGRRPVNLLEYGLFPSSDDPDRHCFPGGVVIDGKPRPLDVSLIREHVTRAWYEEGRPVHPEEGQTRPDPRKRDGYSWIKAPRYGESVVEGGPLARLWIRGVYRRGVSVMDRLIARVTEARLICDHMDEWLERVHPDGPVFAPFEVPKAGEGVGLTGAMRGPLGHWLRIERGRIAHYQVITPTAWNLSPRDDKGRLGAAEEALIGTPVENVEEPVEVGRVIRSFDPCSSCATH